MGRPKLLKDTHNHYFDPQQERSKTIAIGTRRWCGNAGKGGGRSRSAVAIRPIWKNEVYSDNQAEDLSRHKGVSRTGRVDRPIRPLRGGERKGRTEQISRVLATKRLVICFAMSCSRGGTSVCASEVRVCILHQRNKNGSS